MTYSKDIEDVVIATWITGLLKNKDYNLDNLKQELADKSFFYLNAQMLAGQIIEEYYETDRRDAELEAKYHNPE